MFLYPLTNVLKISRSLGKSKENQENPHRLVGKRLTTVSAIYTARGLRSGTAEITAVAFTACGGWHFSEKCDAEIGHLPGA